MLKLPGGLADISLIVVEVGGDAIGFEGFEGDVEVELGGVDVSGEVVEVAGVGGVVFGVAAGQAVVPVGGKVAGLT